MTRGEVLRAYQDLPTGRRWALPETVADENGWPMEDVADHLEELADAGLVEEGKGRLYGAWRATT